MAWIYPDGLTESDFSDGTTNSAWQPQNFVYGANFVLATDGTVTQMGCKSRNDTAALGIKFGLYDSGGNLIVQSTGSIPTSGTLAWNNSGAFSQSLSAGTYFVLCSFATGDGRWGYDTSGDGSFGTEAYASAMAATETITAEGDIGLLYGVRMDFTPSAGGSVIPLASYQYRRRR